jgi:juvenile hormone-III synthase
MFRYKKLIGVDIVHQMTEFAQKHHAPLNPRLSFRQLDILNDDVENIFPEGFDKIFSFYVIHWIKDHNTAAGVGGARLKSARIS